MEKLNNLAILILAAGSSSRLGKPKQLLKYKNESLLKIAVKKALKISSNIFVVLGHEKEKCEHEIKEFKNINLIYNNLNECLNWSFIRHKQKTQIKNVTSHEKNLSNV